MGYGVTWFEGSEARDEHLAVWERNLTLPVTARSRFDWLYRHNPAGPGRLAVLEARAQGVAPVVVGTAGYGARKLQVGSRSFTSAVLANLAVDRAHRTAMPAIMLSRELRRDVLARNALVYAFPNQHAGPLLVKLGYHHLGETRRFVLVLRHGRYVTEAIERRLTKVSRRREVARLARVASAGLDLTRAAMIAARAARTAIEYRLAWMYEPDERFDDLWKQASGDYSLIGVRDAAFVRWRFIARPEGRLELLGLFHRKTGALEGYAVLDREGGVVHLRDLFAPRDKLDPLLRLVALALVQQNVESISLRLCGAPWLAEYLGRLGFSERGDRRTIIAATGAGIEPVPAQILDASRWHLTDADEDA